MGYLKTVLFYVEQSSSKALSRAIKDFVIMANRCTYEHSDLDIQIRRKKMN